MSAKATKQTKRPKDKGKASEIVPDQGASNSSSSDSEDSDVGEQGMARLMAALGEDGLDEVAQQMLKAMDEENNDEESDEDAEDLAEGSKVPKVKVRAEADSDGSGSESEEEGSGDEEASDGEEMLDEEAAEDEDAIELDAVSSVDEDAIPRQKITIDNKDALERIRDSIKLDASLPWTETLTITYPSTHEVDVSNDLDRELSFYKQALHSAEAARTLAESHSLPFTRPTDYFAEMVKSDAHMERIRQRLLDETAGIKKGEEKRREREGKKFGKQVQVEKLRERERSKKDLDEKIKGLKRKRKGGALDDTQGGDFEVALEDAITDHPNKRPRMPRAKRDEKYGRGGRGSVGWRSKQNTRESTDQFESVGRGRGRGGRGAGGRSTSRGGGRGTKRLGKSRRVAGRGK